MDLIVNRNLKSLSHMISIHKRLCQKDHIMRPNRPGGIPSRGSSQLASYSWGWPVSIPTRNFGACAFTLVTGSSGTKYHPLAHEYKISLSFMASFLDDMLANFLLHCRAILWQWVSGTFSCNCTERGGLRVGFGSYNE